MKYTIQGALGGALFNIGKQLLTKDLSQFDWNEVGHFSLGCGSIGLGIDTINYLTKNNENPIPSCQIPERVNQVWEKGSPIKNENPNEWRADAYDNLINYCDYGNRQSIYGWEDDHIFPKSLGGSNDIDNRQPLQWYENVVKGNQYPYIPK